MKNRAVFVSATDTGIGKTVISCAISYILKKQGVNVGVFKPFQSSGFDSGLLISVSGVKDKKSIVNPYYTKEALAPYVSFKRQKMIVRLENVFRAYEELKKRHEFIIVEGAGGLLVPLKKDYLISDLIRDLDIPLVIVGRAGLGTINHTLLTERYALDHGLEVKGIILNGFKGKSLAEATNPWALETLLESKLIGCVPFYKGLDIKNNLKKFLPEIARHIKIDAITRIENRSAELEKLDKKYIWHPFTQMRDWIKEEQIIIDSGKASYVKDTKGRRYLDGTSSLWVNVHGHCKKEIDNAVKKQLGKIAHTTMLGLGSAPAVKLAKRLVELAPPGLSKVFYSDNGSCAVEIGLKMAYQYWRHLGLAKEKFVHLKNSYHGDTVGAVSVGGIDLFHKVYRGLLFKNYAAHSPYCYRCPAGKTYPLCNFGCLAELKSILEKHSHSIAALIVEPLVQAAAGMIVWPRGIYKQMAQLCKKHNILLIADEVAAGIGRTGTMFASSQEGVSPDILCVAKGLTGGYLPLAVTLTAEKIYAEFLGKYEDKKTFFHGHSYTGNPLAAAAALASLDIFKKEKTLERLREKIKLLKEGLKRFKELGNVGDIRQKGFMAGIELVKDKFTKEPYAYEEKMGIKVCQRVRDYGVILRPLGNVIVLMPPLTIDRRELNKLLEATYNSIKEITKLCRDRVKL